MGGALVGCEWSGGLVLDVLLVTTGERRIGADVFFFFFFFGQTKDRMLR